MPALIPRRLASSTASIFTGKYDSMRGPAGMVPVFRGSSFLSPEYPGLRSHICRPSAHVRAFSRSSSSPAISLNAILPAGVQVAAAARLEDCSCVGVCIRHPCEAPKLRGVLLMHACGHAVPATHPGPTVTQDWAWDVPILISFLVYFSTCYMHCNRCP